MIAGLTDRPGVALLTVVTAGGVARSAAVAEEVSAIPTGASGGSCSSGTPGSTGAARTLTAATYTHPLAASAPAWEVAAADKARTNC